RDWDGRARKNAFHYIASWRKEWDIESFLASGEDDIKQLVVPALTRCGLLLAGKRMLELGCGTGRMTHCFARRFENVYALDLSCEMLSRARQIHSGQHNILWLRSNGADLACVISDSMDFVFSYLVLQHLPEEAQTLQYVREILRVLRPGGAFLFQFSDGFAPTMNWRGRLAWGIVDALWSTRLGWLSSAAASSLGLDPAAAGKSWRGASVAALTIAECVRSSGGQVREISGENTPMAWCCGVKL
ncbi:MAG TPA: class I SAM-dependent methyltransferase, partial [Candidatus Dormibacteraeota bacterium]|nr:class I SAM-dependent methyltransferase [Candidatus Dormibacteraeota bacterium]